MAAAGLWFLTGYLVGSVPIGLLIGRLAGIDIRRYGTGNIGASNILRNMGFLPAAAVGVASFAQGALPAGAAAALASSPPSVAAAAVGSVAGYGWSWLLHLRGGRAVGTATGALVAIAPAGILPLLGLYAVGGVLRQPAVGVLLGMAAFLVYMLLWPHPAVLMVAAVLIVALVLSKRLEGLRGDLHVTAGRPAGIVVGRLLFDRRPGQRLAGPRD
jgi:glycerol-3-phosphate acyltransferase PlsY